MKKLYLHLLASTKKYDTLEDLIEAGDSVGVDVVMDHIPIWEANWVKQLGGDMIRAVIDKLYPGMKKQIQKVVNLTHKGRN